MSEDPTPYNPSPSLAQAIFQLADEWSHGSDAIRAECAEDLRRLIHLYDQGELQDDADFRAYCRSAAIVAPDVVGLVRLPTNVKQFSAVALAFPRADVAQCGNYLVLLDPELGPPPSPEPTTTDTDDL